MSGTGIRDTIPAGSFPGHDSHTRTADLRTKLFRPPVPRDAILRDDIVAQLDADNDLPLVLVSAPAGYGKTTVISQWLEGGRVLCVDLPRALGGRSSDLPRLFHDGRSKTSVNPSGRRPKPPFRVGLADDIAIGSAICNDLTDLSEPLVVVLDDYHHMTELAIHELMDFLLRHAPPGLQIALLTPPRSPTLPGGP